MNLASSDQQMFDCPLTDFYCPPDVDFEIVDLNATEWSLAIDECYNYCYSRKDDPTDPCHWFTVHQIMNRSPMCYLLKESCEMDTDDVCFHSGKCMSGPAECPPKFSPDCLIANGYCKFTGMSLEVQIQAQDMGLTAEEECFNACGELSNPKAPSFSDTNDVCFGFTLYQARSSPPTCYLLTEECNLDTIDDCIDQEKCVSGLASCSQPTPSCSGAPIPNIKDIDLALWSVLMKLEKM